MASLMADPGQMKEEQFSFLREDWISKQMKRLEHTYTDRKPLSVFVGTWNVNAKKPKDDIRSWLCPDGGTVKPDIYAIGFQEIVDLNAANLVLDSAKAEGPWTRHIGQTIPSGYTTLASKHMVGVLLIIFVKNEHVAHISEIAADSAGVGILGMGGNKGGVAIRMKLYDSTVCFVCSHLAAHKDNVQGRNSDFGNVCARVRFSSKPQDAQVASGEASLHSAAYTQMASQLEDTSGFGIFDHDNIFWLGDLNYRLTCGDMEQVYRKIHESDIEYLLRHDQLNLERAAGRTFQGFEEGPISFLPTYKFQPGTDVYERREEKKKRFPAWCDRILWRGDHTTLQRYEVSRKQCMSDHKPVWALFDFHSKQRDVSRQKSQYEQLVRQLDQWENEQIPKVRFSKDTVAFSDARYGQPLEETVLLENTGQVVAKFKFVPKLEEESFCLPWLRVTPSYGIILPGDKLTITLSLTCTVDTLRDVDYDMENLEDILILRLEHGRDFFVTVSARYLRSCFGCSIEYLCKTPQPVRFAARHDGPGGRVDRVLAIPKELWRLVDYIFRNGIDEPGLFSTSGDPRQILAIREALDVGEPFPADLSVHSVAEGLIRFLEATPDPVFPPALYNQYQESESAATSKWCRHALLQLPLSHYNVFIYLIAFLREVLRAHKNSEQMASKLVLVFASGLMHATPSSSEPDVRERKAWRILKHYLTHDVL